MVYSFLISQYENKVIGMTQNPLNLSYHLKDIMTNKNVYLY